MSSRQHFCQVRHAPTIRRLTPRPIALFLLALGAVTLLAPQAVWSQGLPALKPPPAVAVDSAAATQPIPSTERVPPGKPVVADELSQVPEVELDATLPRNAVGNQAGQHVATLIGRIKEGNSKRTDGFLQDLLGQRLDLKGMPFAMGDACRLKGERSREFPVAVAVVRDSLRRAGEASKQSPDRAGEQQRVAEFWKQYRDANSREVASERVRHAESARVAALMQVLPAESSVMRLELVKYLEKVNHSDADKALAQMAIFSTEANVRQAALKALKPRGNREADAVLVHGLRYPLPAVATRAAEALVKLDRKDLVPELVDLLDQPDPRLPVITEIDKKKVPVVRELVRVNHNRNCLMCHAPGTTGDQLLGLGLTTAAIPSDPPDSPSDGYRSQPSFPDNLVRIDVTYLRQDFSVMQPVANAKPWPEMQRFDFLVRTRQLTEAEAKTYQEKLSQPGQLSPYQSATLVALRELTGKDADANGKAWRRLLDLPGK